ncbi:GLRA3 [Branchiostoma lanceolatum]|uniref:GLRA3 protein n=1 Tax=Branchiostoma lanceolatum TaxID=7740 RepID=A0A8J9Z0G7_BRALA|nr:GLRA3 [Branchiostoma lanceolatum]
MTETTDAMYSNSAHMSRNYTLEFGDIPGGHIPSFMLFRRLQHYDKRIRPNFAVSRIWVEVQLYVSSISSVSEASMDYILNFFLRQRWNDPRLSYTDFKSSLTLGTSTLAEIWIPDISFKNGKGAAYREGGDHNTLLRISPQGDILLSQKMALLLSCPMDFRMFPFDTQSCGIQMESYGHTTEELVLEWAKPEMEIDLSIRLPEFELKQWGTRRCDNQVLTGNYSCTEAYFKLVRRFGYYLIQAYIPSILLVIISWLTFWINPDVVPARISLGITTVLTSTTLTAFSHGSTPRNSYIRAIDIWMLACSVFVFAALVEFSVSHYIFRRQTKFSKIVRSVFCRNKFPSTPNPPPQQVPAAGTTPEASYINPSNPQLVNGQLQPRARMTQEDVSKLHQNFARRMDIISRFLFPGLFFFFNSVYWLVYSTAYDA